MSTLRPSACACAALLALAPFARAQSVVVVDPNGPVPTIQAGVDLAADGDTVLVRPGQYAPFDLVGRSLTVVGEPGARVVHFVFPPLVGTPDRALEVRHVAAHQSVVVRGIEFTLSYAEPYESALVVGCAGAVRLEDCTFWASHGPGLRAIDSDAVTLVRTTAGSQGPFEPFESGTFEPNAGVELQHSRAFLFDCLVVGSAGRDAHPLVAPVTSPGGPGLLVDESFAAVSGSILLGGRGGGPSTIGPPTCVALADGGPGLVVGGTTGGARVVLLDSETRGGSGGQPAPGCPEPPGATGPDRILASGAIDEPPHERRTFGWSALVREGGLVEAAYQGEPGDQVFLVAASFARPPVLLEPLLLVPHLDPAAALVLPRGALGGTGVLVEVLVAPLLPPGVAVVGLTAQALFVDGLGAPYASGPSELRLVDAAY